MTQLDEVTRLRAENQRLRDLVERLRAELQRLGSGLGSPSGRARDGGDIEWGYQRDDLEDDLGVE